MAENRKIVRVFIASPGDLKEERESTKQVVDELNQTWFAFHGYHIELIGWEITISGFGRPQALINEDLETCEYFLGLLHKRWGTPPDSLGKFTSGFEEEFRSSIARRIATGKPEVSLFFKSIDHSEQQDPGEQLKKVLAFKNAIVEEKKLLYEEFSGLADFQEKVRRCISRYVQRLMKEEESASNIGFQANTGSLPTAVSVANTPLAEGPLSIEGAQFLRDFIAKTEQGDIDNLPTPEEVARFRLLGQVLNTERTDKATLGVHDANIMFEARNVLNLSVRERSGLINAGLVEYEDENTPIWHWLASVPDDGNLAFKSGWGRSDEVKVGALQAMRDIAAPLPVGENLIREDYLKIWLEKDAPAKLKTAALSYLSECGIGDDLNRIRVERDRNDYQTSSAAIDAIIRINLRDSSQKAFAALQELQPEKLEAKLLRDLFRGSAGISDDTLRESLGHRCADVRLEIVRLLRTRKSLDIKTADQLLKDKSTEVRLEAMKFLATHGRTFSDNEARKLLVEGTHSRGLFSLGMALMPVNEERLNEFKDWGRKNASDSELEKTLNGSIFNRKGEFVLGERHFAKYGPQLRRAVGNFYKAEFDAALQMDSLIPQTSDSLQQTKALEEFTRQQHTRAGLDVICRRGDASDLALVRQVLAADFVSFSMEDVEYLRRYGEWSDIALIVAAAERPMVRKDNSTSLLGSWFESSEEKYRIAARGIYELGRGRLDELFSVPMSDDLRTRLILQMPDAGFITLGDHVLMELFQSKDLDVRKAAALRCAGALPRRRQAALLSSFMKRSARYYNVIHWLDLGISLSKPQARATIRRILRRTWPL